LVIFLHFWSFWAFFVTKKTPFSPASEKGHFDGLVDEGKQQSQKLALRTALAKNTKLAKT